MSRIEAPRPLVALLASLAFALLALGAAPAPASAGGVYLPGAEPAPYPRDTTLTIRVQPMGDGCYAAKVASVWTGWIELPDGILVIDSSGADSSGAALADTIRARSPGLPFRYLVLTSPHLDHISGARPFLDGGARLVTQSSVSDEIDSVLQVTPDPKRELRVASHERLGTDSKPVDVIWLGSDAASRGDLIVSLPTKRLLYSGDLISFRSIPWLMDRDLSVPGWIASLDSLFTKAFAIDSIVPGHGEIGPAAKAINFTKYYIQDARQKAGQYAAWKVPLTAVKEWGYLGAYEGLEFYEEVHYMNMRRLYREAKGIKTTGRDRVRAFRK